MKLLKLPRCHWNLQHGRKVKSKKAFDTNYKAGEYLIKHHLENEYQSYKCDVCGKWHIGHINKQV